MIQHQAEGFPISGQKLLGNVGPARYIAARCSLFFLQ